MNKNSDHSVSQAMPGGSSATFTVVVNPVASRLYLWLEPGMDPDEIAPFYRVTEKDAAPVESWQSFQDGDAIAPYAGEKRARLGAIETPGAGQYILEASIFTGLRTVKLPGIEIALEAVAEDTSIAEARETFNGSFFALFHKFLDKQVSAREQREYFDNFDRTQVDFLAAAIVELGAPEDYLDDDETRNLGGFFEFIDFVTAIAHSCGDAALAAIAQHPDSPTNRHYIGYVKQHLENGTILDVILDKYPFCAR